jgi:PTH1 family peptidyl-tRNA hydrolase
VGQLTGQDGPWLVVGLGNPGPQYASHRHNVGAMVVGALARRLGVRLTGHRAGAAVAQGRIGEPGPSGEAVVLAVPSSYMNTSGGPVAALARFYRVSPARLVVIHDDLDLPFGTIRLKRGGGEGGHNGLRSVSRALGTRDYLRVRVGIGRPPGRMDPADFVLRPFTAGERAELDLITDRAADAVETLITEGLDKAQLRFHSPASPGGA